MDYGYGLGIVPPQDPVYLREFERRTREWHEEIIEDSESLLQRRLQNISFSYHIALTLPQTIGRIELASPQDGRYATLSRRYGLCHFGSHSHVGGWLKNISTV